MWRDILLAHWVNNDSGARMRHPNRSSFTVTGFYLIFMRQRDFLNFLPQYSKPFRVKDDSMEARTKVENALFAVVCINWMTYVHMCWLNIRYCRERNDFKCVDDKIFPIRAVLPTLTQMGLVYWGEKKGGGCLWEGRTPHMRPVKHHFSSHHFNSWPGIPPSLNPLSRSLLLLHSYPRHLVCCIKILLALVTRGPAKLSSQVIRDSRRVYRAGFVDRVTHGIAQ